MKFSNRNRTYSGRERENRKSGENNMRKNETQGRGGEKWHAGKLKSECIFKDNKDV